MDDMDQSSDDHLEVVRVHRGRRFRKGGNDEGDKRRLGVKQWFGKTGEKNEFFQNLRRHDLYEEYSRAFLESAKLVDDHATRTVADKIMRRIADVDRSRPNIPTLAVSLGVLRNEERLIFSRLKRELTKRRIRMHIISSRCDVEKAIKEAVDPFVDSFRCEKDGRSELREERTVVEESKDAFQYDEKTSSISADDNTEATIFGESIVFILEGLPEFQEKTLEAFIGYLSAIKNEKPVILVLGIADSSAGIQDYIPSSALKRLEIQTVSGVSPEVYREALFEQTILSSRFPFFIGGKTMRMLHHAFFNADESIPALKHRIVLCMLEHFYFKLEAAFCCSGDDIAEFVRTVEDKDLEVLKALGSFKRFMKEVQPKEISVDEDLRKSVVHVARELPAKMKEWISIMRVVHTLGLSFPDLDFPSSFASFYSEMMASDFVGSKKYVKLVEKLQTCSKEELTRSLEASEEKLTLALSDRESEKIPITERLAHAVKWIPWALGQLEKSLVIPVDTENEDVDAEEGSTFAKTMSRSAFKETLRKKVAEEREKKKPDEAVRNRVIDEFLRLLKTVSHPSSYLWHEIFFFEDHETIQNLVFGYGDDFTTCALNDPAALLGCDCCELEDEHTVRDTMPDVCLAFRLLSEYDVTKVSLRDWLYQFDAVLNSGNEDAEAEPSVDVQARFVEAVGELQLLGYIKPAGRPQDHVEKLF